MRGVTVVALPSTSAGGAAARSRFAGASRLGRRRGRAAGGSDSSPTVANALTRRERHLDAGQGAEEAREGVNMG